MAYKKEQMVYYDYYWGMAYEANDPHISGDFDDTVLRRTAGKEMLYFVNHCADLWHWTERMGKAFRKLERMVRDMVPQRLKTQQEVKQWVDEHMDLLWSKTEVREAE